MKRALLSLLYAPCLALVLPAQQQGTTLLSRLHNRTFYAGVWGYSAPDNREFAIVGEQFGNMVVDISNPSAPAEVAFYTTPPNIWHELTSYGPFIYSVSEGHSGLRIIDLSNPSAPADRGYVHQSTWNNAHSIHCDPDTGRIYVNGTSGGLYVLDAAANPLNPPQIGRYFTSYVHDCYVRRGKGYLAEINRGTLRIANVNNANAFTPISGTFTPGTTPHNAWVTDDDRLLLTTDENGTGFLQLYDISNPFAPVIRSAYSVSGHIVHNVYGIGRTAYVAWYTDGVHVLDLSTPSSAVRRIAYYDTSAVAGPNYDGCWGVYPWLDSGLCLASDMQTGLHVLRVDVGHMNRYGNGVASTGGKVARIQTEGSAARVDAGAFRLEISNLAANANYGLLFSSAAATLPFLGVTVHVSLSGAVLLTGTADAQGKASLALPIPNDPGLAQQRVYLQVLAADPAGPQGLVASRGHWFGIAP